MRVSQWIRQWQITGAVPDEGDAQMAFWCGWLSGGGKTVTLVHTPNNFDKERDMAIKAAEFIESRARE